MCKIESEFFPRDNAVSPVSKRLYDCAMLSGILSLNCHFSDLIYLITGGSCNIQ